MIRRFSFGEFFPTGAVTERPASEKGPVPRFSVKEKDGRYSFVYEMKREDRVLGLGEQVRGMNKRGWVYRNYACDDNAHTETKHSLYCAHNFFVVEGDAPFGVFFDCAGEIEFDIGYTDTDILRVSLPCGADLYFAEGDEVLGIVREFRKLFGKSYIPPKWAFGFMQSRYGYACEEDIRSVVRGYKEAGMPLDSVCLDIDYMERYKDFTVSEQRFPNFADLVADMRAEGVRLVPIIDAAVKVEKGYRVYEEGREKGYFCKGADGKPYVVGVWPGDAVLPDFLNAGVREWFGEQYRPLLDLGIEGFWNDMNEPSLFYSKKRFREFAGQYLPHFLQRVKETDDIGLPVEEFMEFLYKVNTLAGDKQDHEEFFHDVDGQKIRHSEVHNLYGSFMMRSAAEYFEKYDADKRYLLFSRSSAIGAHRSGGMWMGDNSSWWSHILLNLQMLPALNMAGFLYAGADLGGFMHDATEDLVLRWLALGVFTPLMRNHSALGTREQECYRFKYRKLFKNILGIRYAFIPYLYSEFVKCAVKDDMLFMPLSFAYPHDERARSVEDQLLVGESLMIAPVYTQNAEGRHVYLPESMKLIRMKSASDVTEQILPQGDHYISVPLGEVAFFLRHGKVLPLAKEAKCVDELDMRELRWLKNIERDTEYELLYDEGSEKDDLAEKFQKIVLKP